MGFRSKILSLNDLTTSPIREPIVYNDNEPTRVQTCDDDTNLFPGKLASR